MREILFRGKSLKNGEFVEGHYFKNDSGTFIFTFPYNANYADIDIMVKADPETVGQYTGVNDKNGKKIFEGDIVRLQDCHSSYYVVVWHKYKWIFRYSNKETEYYPFCTIDDNFRRGYGIREYVEVVGNIHDNPDILENHEEEN